MRLPVLILFLVATASAMGLWSLFQGASISTVALRMIATLITVEVAYFAGLLIMAYVGDAANSTSEEFDRKMNTHRDPLFVRRDVVISPRQ